MLKRLGSRLLIVTALISLLLMGLLWGFLAYWVPVQGKLMLIETLESNGKLKVAIGAMRYQPLRGCVLEDVLVIDKNTQTPWLQSTQLDARMSWWALLVQRTLNFDIDGPITLPCQTTLRAMGRYQFSSHALSMELHSTDIPISSLSKTLRDKIPIQDMDGQGRLNVLITKAREEPLQISGEVLGQDMRWNHNDLHATGELKFEGRFIAPGPGSHRWDGKIQVSLKKGHIEGLPSVGGIEQISARATLLPPDALKIDELIGQSLGSAWKAQGLLSWNNPSFIEFHISSDAKIAALTSLWPDLKENWQPTGSAHIEAVCRGPWPPLQSLPPVDPAQEKRGTFGMDCLARSHIQKATLSGSRLLEPLQEISGDISYDHLTSQLIIHDLAGSIQQEVLNVYGNLSFSTPPAMALGVIGKLPLEMLKQWLPQPQPFTEISGMADVALELEGPLSHPIPTGKITLGNTYLKLKALSQPIENVQGLLVLNEQEITMQDITLTVAQQPLTLTATITRENAPHLAATIQWPAGQFDLRGQLSQDAFVVQEGKLSLSQSKLQIRGTVSRNPERPHALNLEGSLNLRELSQLPFLPSVSWVNHLPQEPISLKATVEGYPTRWQEATIQGYLRAPSIRIQEIPVERVNCQFEQQAKVLRLKIPEALIAGGKLQGELKLNYREETTDYLVQADMTALQLEGIAHAISAWRNRTVKGTASAHLELSGTWKDPASYQGEGWLNASGEQLGDIPLLDRLFERGIFGPLAERLGLEPLRRAVITQASLHYRVAQEHIDTDDLRLAGLVGTAAIVIYARGRIGFDQRIAFEIEPELSEQILYQSEAIPAIANVLRSANIIDGLHLPKLFRYQLTGTLKEPKARFQFSPGELIKELLFMR